jgi:DNA-binding response OmpR family regulator
MRSWTWEVTRNEVRRLAEKRRGRLRSEVAWENLADNASGSFPNTTECTSHVLRLDIQRALAKLPTTQSEAASLYYLLGHSVDEIAERFGRPPGTVKSWLYHARHSLALEMEAYAPIMTDKRSPQESAAPPDDSSSPASDSPKAYIVQTNLDISLMAKITDVLRTGGFQVRVLTLQQIRGLMEAASVPETASLPTASLLLLDETIAGRPALEFVMNWNAEQKTHNIPVLVLMNEAPSALTAAAYFGAGAASLINKTSEDDLALLVRPHERRKRVFSWVHFTEKARRVIYEAQIEARRLKHNDVKPEHLLLGLTSVPDSVGARILTEKLGLSLKTLRDVVDQGAPQGADEVRGDMQLDTESKRVIDLAYEEAGLLNNDYIGVEHFLLGMVRIDSGLAAEALRSLGLELKATRTLVREWQQNPG